VSNIDDNVGKVLKKLKDLKIEKNTVVIYMTDNGPQQVRYIAGMRGKKGSVYEGGVRVPFFMSYPNLFKKSKDINVMTAHIDILPTLAELCNAKLPSDRIIDGKSFLPLLKGETTDWNDRSLFFYWTRRYPELYNNMAIRKENYKLVGHTNYDAKIEKFELFDVLKDPFEENNIVLEKKEIAEKLKTELDSNYNELINSVNLISPPRPIVGSNHENPIILNRNDASGERGIWAQEEIYGKWKVHIKKGNYDIKFKFIKPLKSNGRMYLEANTKVLQTLNERENTDIIEMKNVHFPEMDCDLIPFYAIGSKNIFPFWMELKKID
jgi:arylsulfatase